METVAQLKAWGNSVGVILPKEKLREEHLAVNDEVEIIVKKKSIFRSMFGVLKDVPPTSHKSTDALLKEIDKEFASRYE